MTVATHRLTHLETLEAQSIHILREVAAETRNAALLFSGGKDSIAMAWLAHAAFHPAAIPFTALHVDTGHNFPEALELRDRLIPELGMQLKVAALPEMIASGRITEPAGTVSRNRLQSVALLTAATEHHFDALIGGGRRDEDKARAKERVFSFRDEFGQWNPRHQRPELWHLYNARIAPGQNMRVFPLSNWTELDVWQYIAERHIELPSLYYSHRRPVFERDGMLFAVNPFLPMRDDERPREALVRFRTVGDMTCTGAILSAATTPAEVITEIAGTRVSERGATRADDRFNDSAMEDRKREGYF
ncbi:sulfate adenylyltransferase subunit CysD [Actinocrispum wychmicini]|uniref:Sulfate adenylyltransferase subunit 2 n=1 Tax=Actinocrispum wychmicini TaxID=1213861 RepID=A0A4R2JC90_9PSEU|nr:sulfate adenylyltransferase subunit CysD [Actinocrispum wychmicini]TCO55612.1 sulfate adenylyltransferase subunit 2 [Actinocrispum wychmicini]